MAEDKAEKQTGKEAKNQRICAASEKNDQFDAKKLQTKVTKLESQVKDLQQQVDDKDDKYLRA